MLAPSTGSSFIQSAGWPVPITLDAAFTGGDLTAYTYTDVAAASSEDVDATGAAG